jgi:hypothetical protein
LPPVNVHVLEKYTHTLPRPFYCSVKEANAENAINIMYFQKNENTMRNIEDNGHHVWIKNLSRALSPLTLPKSKKYVCARCHTPYTSREQLNSHDNECSKDGIAQIKKIPHCRKHTFNMKTCIDCIEARTCKFKDFQSKQKLPVVIYFDCEALNRKVNVRESGG